MLRMPGCAFKKFQHSMTGIKATDSTMVTTLSSLAISMPLTGSPGPLLVLKMEMRRGSYECGSKYDISLACKLYAVASPYRPFLQTERERHDKGAVFALSYVPGDISLKH